MAPEDPPPPPVHHPNWNLEGFVVDKPTAVPRGLKDTTAPPSAGARGCCKGLRGSILGAGLDLCCPAPRVPTRVRLAAGYRLLLQIHDEVIVEGPEEHWEEAMAEVKKCMEEPWDNVGLGPMRVKLEVDAKHAKSWLEAK